MNINKEVVKAIYNTKKVDNGYWNNSLKQRLINGLGSHSMFENISELECAIICADWREYNHPSISEGCRAFITSDICGILGIVPINNLPEDTLFKFEDPKNTGKVSCCVSSDKLKLGRSVDYSVIILGKEIFEEKEIEIVFTFHAGSPIRPSVLLVENVDINKNYTKQEVLALGFEYCKI